MKKSAQRLVDIWLWDTAVRCAAACDLSDMVERYAFSEPHEFVTAHLHRTMPMVAHIGRRYFHDPNDVDDFSQTVMQEALKGKHSYKGDQTPASLKNWIAGIAYLTAKNMRRQRGRKTYHQPLTSVSPDFDAGAIPEHKQSPSIPEEERQAIHADIAAVENPTHKTILTMRTEGHKLPEIAKHLGVTPDAATRMHSRVLDTLRDKSKKRMEQSSGTIQARLAAIANEVDIERYMREAINPKHTDKAPVDDETISVLKDIDELSDEVDKQVMRHRMQGLTSKEVATMLRMSEDNVRQRQKRVMDALRQRAALRAQGATTTSRRFAAMWDEVTIERIAND